MKKFVAVALLAASIAMAPHAASAGSYADPANPSNYISTTKSGTNSVTKGIKGTGPNYCVGNTKSSSSLTLYNVQCTAGPNSGSFQAGQVFSRFCYGTYVPPPSYYWNPVSCFGPSVTW